MNGEILNRQNNNRPDWEERAAKLFCLLCAAAGIYLTCKYLLGIALPFLIAWLVASAALPIARRLSLHTRIPPRVCISLTVLVIWTLIFTLTAMAIERAASELGSLISGSGGSTDAIGGILGRTMEWFDSLGSRLPVLSHLRDHEEFADFFDGLDTAMGSIAGKLLGELTSKLPALAASAIGAMPSILLALTVAVISAFYFALDHSRILNAVTAILPQSIRGSIPELRRRAAVTAAGYIKAYLIILGITLIQLYIGFLILGVDYAFILAALISVIDILPVLGIGTVLIPWGGIEIMLGNPGRGIGLIVIFAVIEIIRQFIEPRIIGRTLGIHPLLTLTAMYIGISVFGVAGIIIGPLLALALRAAADAKVNTEADNMHSQNAASPPRRPQK